MDEQYLPTPALAATRRTGPESSAGSELLRRKLEARLFDRPFVPVKVGRFSLLSTIGAGGMGIVYLGYDETLDRKVAIKVIRPEHATSSASRARMLEEARAMARVSSPNTVAVFEAGEHNDTVFIAMEYVDGGTLGQWLDRRERSPDDVLRVFIAAGRGLVAAHAAGVVHRDFKPDNVLVTPGEEVKVTDFGLAGFVAVDETISDVPRAVERTRSTVGTPQYMSPEQFDAQLVDERSDQFSFGVALYEALYGQRPYEGTTFESLAMSVTEGRLRPPPAGVSVPARVTDAIERALSIAPSDRFPSMRALLDVLAPPRKGNRAVLTAGLIGVVAVAATAFVSDSPTPCAGAEAELATTWNDERSAALATAADTVGIAATINAWQRVQPRIERFAQQWRDEHERACKATRVSGEQSEALLDKRMACLGTQRTRLQTTLDTLAEGGLEVWTEADTLVARLGVPADCGDPARLRAAMPPPPADLADDVAQVERMLAKVDALRITGGYQDQLALARRAHEAASAVDYPPVANRALVALATAHARSHHDDQTRDTFTAALQATLAVGQYDEALRAARGLAVHYALRRRAFDLAGPLWVVANGLADEIGTPMSAGQLHADRATSLSGEGKYDAAIAEYDRSLAAFARAEPTPTESVIRVRRNRAETLVKMGRAAEAIDELTAVRGEVREFFGPEHPMEVRTLVQLSAALFKANRLDEAESMSARAVEISRVALPEHPVGATAQAHAIRMALEVGDYAQAIEDIRALRDRWIPILGKDHDVIARTYATEGVALARSGDFAAARQAVEKNLRYREKTLPPEHPELIESHSHLSSICTMAGAHEQAERHARAANELRQRAFPPDSPRVAWGHSQLGGVLLDLDRPDEAEVELRAALDIYQRDEESHEWSIAVVRNALGLIELRRDDYGAAIEHLQATVDAARTGRGEDHPDHARALHTLSRVYLKGERWGEAAAVLRHALDIYDGRGLTSPDVATVRFWLAIARYELGHATEARALAKRAHADLQGAQGEVAKKDRAAIEAWLADPNAIVDF